MKEIDVFFGQEEYESWYNWIFVYMILLLMVLLYLIFSMSYLNAEWNYIHRYSLYLEKHSVGYINLFILTFLIGCFWKLLNPIRLRIFKSKREEKREYYRKKL